MAVDSLKVNAGKSERIFNGLKGEAAGDTDAELAVFLAGADLGVRVRVDAGRDAQQNGLALAARRRQLREAPQLVGVVDDKAAHARLDTQLQFFIGLEIAVVEDLLRWEARLERRVELAA